MNRSAAELKFMDVAEINALLYKKGINEQTIRGYTPKELADVLNVEYVIIGSVLQDKGSLVTVTNSILQEGKLWSIMTGMADMAGRETM